MAKREKQIRLPCLKEDDSASSSTINDNLYFPEVKVNLLSLGQLSERGVDMKTTGVRICLHQGEKTVMTGSKIDRVWLMNSINWPIGALSAREVVKKCLMKSKNYILHASLRYMGETQSKRMISMVHDIDGDQTKICFCESYNSAKITRNLNTKPVLEVITKLSRVNIDLWGSSSDISLERNCYI